MYHGEQNKLNENFNTSDFVIASTLICFGFNLVELDKSNKSRIIFSFEKNSKIEKTVKEFWENKLTVNPKLFFNAQKELKTRMYSGDQDANR